MRKNFIYALASVAALSLIASCAKEVAGPEVEPAKESAGEQIIISASFPAEGFTKVEFSEYDYNDKLDLYWVGDETITVTDASDPTNTQTFTLESGAGDVTATFKGTAPKPAASYIISIDEAAGSYAEQTQACDGDTGHLMFVATLSGVTDYTSFEFSQDWADANGATFTASSVLRLRAALPDSDPDLLSGAVTAVIFKASDDIFAGSNQLKVNIADSSNGHELGALTVYANLPGEQAIAAGTQLLVSFQVSDQEYDKYTAYRELPAMTIKAGQVNTLSLNCTNVDKYANANNTDIGTSSNPYLIADQHQMANLRDLLADGETKYVKLVDNIDMTGVNWQALNNTETKESEVVVEAKTFKKGINIDGQNYTISNLSADATGSYPSFAGVAYGTYKNIIFDNAYIDGGSNNIGVFAGYIGTVVAGVNRTADCSGITIINSTVTGTAEKTSRNSGGFAGVIGGPGSRIDNCHVSDTYVEQTTTSYNTCSVGGLIGNVNAECSITNCTVKANVNNAGSYYTGGVIGQIGSAVDVEVKSCAYLGGTVSSSRSNTNSPVGGFVGRTANSGFAVFTSCYVENATINALNCGRSAGFIGDAGSGDTYKKCYVQNSIISSTSQRIGGFVGNTNSQTPGEFVSCYVKNTTISGGLNTGGFGGVFYKKAQKCYVDGCTITAEGNNVGGFAGYPEGATITNCYVTADINGGSNTCIGGFAGIGKGKNSISYCFENATISGSGTGRGAFIGYLDVIPTSVTKNVAWNSALDFYGAKNGTLDDAAIDAAITGNYTGTSGSISNQATTLGWDGSVWNLSGSIPALK